MCHVSGKQLEMLSYKTVNRNRIKPVATQKAINSQKYLVTLYTVGWVIITNGKLHPRRLFMISVVSITDHLVSERTSRKRAS